MNSDALCGLSILMSVVAFGLVAKLFIFVVGQHAGWP